MTSQLYGLLCSTWAELHSIPRKGVVPSTGITDHQMGNVSNPEQERSGGNMLRSWTNTELTAKKEMQVYFPKEWLVLHSTTAEAYTQLCSTHCEKCFVRGGRLKAHKGLALSTCMLNQVEGSCKHNAVSEHRSSGLPSASYCACTVKGWGTYKYH